MSYAYIVVISDDAEPTLAERSEMKRALAEAARRAIWRPTLPIGVERWVEPITVEQED